MSIVKEIQNMPIEAIVAGATALIPLVQDIIDSANKGATQEELNAKWAAMQQHLRASETAWQAAGGTVTGAPV